MLELCLNMSQILQVTPPGFVTGTDQQIRLRADQEISQIALVGAKQESVSCNGYIPYTLQLRYTRYIWQEGKNHI